MAREILVMDYLTTEMVAAGNRLWEVLKEQAVTNFLVEDFFWLEDEEHGWRLIVSSPAVNKLGWRVVSQKIDSLFKIYSEDIKIINTYSMDILETSSELIYALRLHYNKWNLDPILQQTVVNHSVKNTFIKDIYVKNLYTYHIEPIVEIKNVPVTLDTSDRDVNTIDVNTIIVSENIRVVAEGFSNVPNGYGVGSADIRKSENGDALEAEIIIPSKYRIDSQQNILCKTDSPRIYSGWENGPVFTHINALLISSQKTNPY